MSDSSAQWVFHLSRHATGLVCLSQRRMDPALRLGVSLIQVNEVLLLSECFTEPHDGKSLLFPSPLLNGGANFEMISDTYLVF